MSNYNPPPDEGAPTRPMNPIPTNPQGGYQQPYQQGYPQQGYQQNPYPGAQPPKKGGALKWILIGCGGFIFIGLIVFGSLFYYGYNKAKQAGLDPGLMQRNPALAIAKMAIKNNPDVEYVSDNETNNTITVRDKKTGKTVILTFEQDKNGHINFKAKDADGKEVSMSINGEKGAVDINSPDGNVKIGTGSVKNLPSWLPAYPDVDIQGTYAVDSNESSGAGFNFTTEDSAEEVIDFYEDRLKEEGFKITRTTTQQGSQSTITLSGSDANYHRSVVVTTTVTDGDTKVNVISQTKK